MTGVSGRTGIGRWLVVGGLAAAAMTGCRNEEDASATAAAAPPPVVLGPENIARVDTATLATGAIISGTLTAEREAQIRAEISGSVREVRGEQGDRVARGAVLARIDETTLRDAFLSARAGARSAETVFRDAQRNLEREERLHAAGAVAERDLERSRSNLSSAEAALADARARLVSAQEQLAKATVRAPFAGVVSEREVNAGDVVQPGAPLYTVVDPSRMRLEATVPVDFLRTLKVGTPVEFEVGGLQGRFVGKVDRINPAVDPATRQVRIYVTLPNREEGLVAGLFAEGRVETEARKAVAAPLSAVNEQGATPTVLRVRNARVERIPVELGLRDHVAERVELKSGVAAGDTLLLSSAQDLTPGTVVRIRQDQGAAQQGGS